MPFAYKARIGFNSSMVRLKAPMPPPPPPLPEVLFQFQYGAIKGTQFRRSSRLSRPRFNSSMVRLKEHAQNAPLLPYYRFQFQYGAIKGLDSP